MCSDFTLLEVPYVSVQVCSDDILDRQTMRQQIVTERVFAEWRFLVQSGLVDSVNGIRLFLFSHYAIFARKTLE